MTGEMQVRVRCVDHSEPLEMWESTLEPLTREEQITTHFVNTINARPELFGGDSGKEALRCYCEKLATFDLTPADKKDILVLAYNHMLSRTKGN